MTAIFAHRGCVGVPAPRENTIDAFRAARHAGADGVELDVRATADGALAVLHDRHVPGVANVTNISSRQLPRSVPLLAQALAVCRGMRVNVEIKGGPPDAAVLSTFLATGDHPQVLVSSFHAASLEVVRRLAPGVPTGLLVDWRTNARDAIVQAQRLGCATLHPFVTQVDAALVAGAREAGLGVHVWTVNADEDIAALGALGVDAVITDRVDAAVEILGRSRAAPPPGWNGGDGTE
jgi:glycerophosphoryl diester phosphodiesterase